MFHCIGFIFGLKKIDHEVLSFYVIFVTDTPNTRPLPIYNEYFIHINKLTFHTQKCQKHLL